MMVGDIPELQEEEGPPNLEDHPVSPDQHPVKERSSNQDELEDLSLENLSLPNQNDYLAPPDQHVPGEEESQGLSNQSSSSTPRRHSQPVTKLGDRLTPKEKIARKIRRYSDLSDASNYQASQEKVPKKKKNSAKPKVKIIQENGSFYLDKAESCELHYMENFFEVDQSETVKNTIVPILLDEQVDPKRIKRIQFLRDESQEESSFSSTDSSSQELLDITKHLQEKVGLAVHELFNYKHDLRFSTVSYSLLQSENDYLPYQAYHDHDEDTVVALLTFGSPRTLSMKTTGGKKISHQVALHPGTLLIMTGKTQSKYTYSVLKGGSVEQLSVFLIGRKLSVDSDSTKDSIQGEHRSNLDTDSESVTSYTTTDSDSDLYSERSNIETFSLFSIPGIKVSDEALANINPHDEEENKPAPSSDSRIRNHLEIPPRGIRSNARTAQKITDRRTSHENDRTVIHLDHDPSIIRNETLVTCIQHMPLNTLLAELSRNGLPGESSENIEALRSKLIVHLLSLLTVDAKPAVPVTPSQSCNTDAIERSLVNFSNQLTNLTTEIAHLKLEVKTRPASFSSSKQKVTAEHKEYGDRLQKARLATLEVEEKLLDLESRTMICSQKATDAEAIVVQSRDDLERWYNSAFFREDSNRIKDIHDMLSSPKLESHPRPRTVLPLSEELQLSRFSDELPEDQSPLQPYEAPPAPFEELGNDPFASFNVRVMNLTTDFDTTFTNRVVGYYGSVAYKYGSTTHKPRPFSDNPYLLDLFNSVKKEMPDIEVNSALITKFEHPGSHLPAHSDDEPEIAKDSIILTVSLGSPRRIQFHDKKGHTPSETLVARHGNAYLMSRRSQDFFQHQVLPADGNNNGDILRISVTFRNITAPAVKAPKASSYSSMGNRRGKSRGRSNSIHGQDETSASSVIGHQAVPPPSKSRGRSNGISQTTSTSSVIGYHATPPSVATSSANAPFQSRNPTLINMTDSVSGTHRKTGYSSTSYPSQSDSRPRPHSSGHREPATPAPPVQTDRRPRLHSSGHRESTAPAPPVRTFTTVLITDSIMRQTPNDGLGVNHELLILNRRNAAGLSENRTTNYISHIKPDFIYVHLGINDLLDMKMPGEVFEEYRRFDNFVSKKLPKTRLYFSLPLPTTYKKECVIIEEVHHLMSDYIKDTEGDKSIIDRVTHVNRNYNMRSGNWEQKTHLYKADGIHLSDAGKDVMLQNFRRSIHDLSRRIKMEERGSASQH